MGFGGLCPFPMRFGGAAGRRLRALTNSLAKSRGTAYDTSSTSIVWTECAADARAVSMIWEANTRMGAQMSSSRMTCFLDRWERIFGIYPRAGAGNVARRAAIAARFAVIARAPTMTAVEDLCRLLLPNTFVAIHYDTAATAMQHVYTSVAADGGVTTPAGTTSITADGMWGSSIHSFHIEVAQPAGMSAADFNAEVAGIHNGILRRFVPSWTKFNTYTTSPFRLGDAPNLDAEGLA